jgi:hypothetical protein
MSKIMLEGSFEGKLCAFGDELRESKTWVLCPTWEIIDRSGKFPYIICMWNIWHVFL